MEGMRTMSQTPQGQGQPGETGHSPRPTREEALTAAGKAWDEAEAERAIAHWKSQKPWPGTMQRQDRVLLWLLIGIPAFFLLTMPLRPFLIADHAVPLAFVTGSHAAVGAASAFAGVGQGSLWVVIVAGVIGKVKIDWLFWWVGRRWGRGIVAFLVPSERGRQFAERLETMNPWVMRLLIPLSYLPGVPAGIPHVMAGVSGMRLRTYLLLDVIGALMITAVVAAIGYHSGQAGVDVVLLIDSYALWLMLAIIFGMAAIPTYTSIRDQRARRQQALGEAAEAYDAETARLAVQEAPGAASRETAQDDPATPTPPPNSRDD
ncbi:DedA family protein [Nocardiopsis sp. L17-MgMaSL7]|uniref:DedA family protein n=1 Tax=Nocardiopsis sp. L17-MgMaSL7 TaxID=1938893 RepID=UPI00351A8167